MTCSDSVRLGLGPVVGEVTSTEAVILLEVKRKDSESGKADLGKSAVRCDLYCKGDTAPTHSLALDLPSRQPRVFVFSELEPATEYVAVFNGINAEETPKVFAKFRTKPRDEDIKRFRILALSCDRPDRLMLGQVNPWHEVARKSYDYDVILHLGDQVYNKGEDSDKTCQLFGTEYEQIEDGKRKRMWKKRAEELLAKKYRFTWNRKKTRESLQRGCHLMIWSDNDVANDFTTMKDQSGYQAYPPAFLQSGIEMYRQYQRQLWDPAMRDEPSDEEFFMEWHSHVYGPVGIFLMDIRGHRITGDGVQHSENTMVSDKQWEAFGERNVPKISDNFKLLLQMSSLRTRI